MSSDPFTVDDSCSLFEATRTLVEADRSEAFVTADERLVGCFRLSNWTDKIKRLNI
jgi:predicted transcriptional regulator